uniref:Heavy metal-binding protein HIP-like n=1 Tax=Crassostrea virginica TaxID=6565 RepID=A0A8B8B6G5_CRAVI|nr:heavy metal-binding protein HIP-like [Crassostrea virginica]XP_022299006.1 heavy metal-binding protein HIP-like [Crassostrea virginica]
MESVFVILLAFTTIVSGGGHETPQQVVTRYNNYKTICTGLGYQNVRCDAPKKDIAFQSSLTKHLQNMNNEETVIFDKVSLNEGNAYNQKTGEFTAAVEGVYSFSWKMFTSRGKYFITHIVHNGNPIAYNHCDGRGISVGHVSSSNQANIKMKRGDKVWIKTRKGDGLFAHGGNWCDFSGYKI